MNTNRIVNSVGIFQKVAGTAIVLAFAATVPAQAALNGNLTGEQVVHAVCARCHATGAHGAPKIGDKKAWSKRAARGLGALTGIALKGIRNMPAHGGNPNLSDLEIQRAITYMVNKSGGHWIMPISRTHPIPSRSGKQIVEEQCIKCHGTGVGGAPRIGDRAAWIKRGSLGLDSLVRSAINGHGGMPARGGMANLTDNEIRSAVIYMFNQGIKVKK